MSADPQLDKMDHATLSWLATFVCGRTIGLITADQPHRDAACNRAQTETLSYELRRGLGIITLALHTHEALGDVEPDPIELTLLVVGPSGDDHGRVKGALRTWGVSCGQPVALLKPHDAAAIRPLWLHDPPPAHATTMADAPFDLSQLGLYHALLRGRVPQAIQYAVEIQTPVSFFSRRPTVVLQPASSVP